MTASLVRKTQETTVTVSLREAVTIDTGRRPSRAGPSGCEGSAGSLKIRGARLCEPAQVNNTPRPALAPGGLAALLIGCATTSPMVAPQPFA